MRRRLLAFLAAVLGLASPALADLDAKAEIGFDGRWIVGAATPVAVTLSNSGAEAVDVDLALAQGDEFRMSADEMIHHRRVRVPAQAAREEVFLLPGPRNSDGALRLTVEVDPTVPIHGGGATADRGKLTFDVSGGGGAYSRDSIEYASHVVGVVGDSNQRIATRVRAADLSDDAKNREPQASRRLEVLSVAPEALRLAPLGLDGIEALVVCDPDAEFAADPLVAEAVLDWVALGGRLVVSLGEHAGQFSASPFAREMPATWTGAEHVAYEQRFAVLDDGDRSAHHVVGAWARLAPAKTAVASGPDDAPDGVERAVGRGRIVLLPYDFRTLLSAPGLDERRVRSLLEPVVELPERSPKDEQPFWNDDRSEASLVRALQAGAFEPPPLPLVVLGIILYVVVVGPLDWFVLKRLKKERLTTLTFLGAVSAFTLLAYGASLALFSTGARVNRVVFADLADSGRDGRQVLRCVEVGGWYSPTGADQAIVCAQPSILLPPSLPGMAAGGDVGTTLPVEIVTRDPLRPAAMLQLAFRSQRIVRIASVGTLGPTIDVEWDGAGGVRVVNGLPVDLDQVFVYVQRDQAYDLGPATSGATTRDGRFETTRSLRTRSLAQLPEDSHPSRGEVQSLLETLTLGDTVRDRKDDEDCAKRRKAGVETSTFAERGRAIVVAFASRTPTPLPGDGDAGDTYVVIRKEVPLP